MPSARKSSKKFSILVTVLFLACLALIIWHTHSTNDPEKVFMQSIQRNMGDEGVTCEETQTIDNSTTTQKISLDLISKSDAHATTHSTHQSTTVATEEIVTKSADYVRYTAMSAPKSTTGKSLDVSKVLNVWTKADKTNSSSGSLFGRTALGNCVVPLAHLNRGQIDKLMVPVRQSKVFQTNYGAVAHQRLAGKAVFVYDVTVPPEPYITFMKQVAASYGLKDLDGVKTSTYAQQAPEKLRFYIDPRSSRLQKIQYTAGQHSIVFSDYGTVPRITVPSKTVSASELQQRLQTQ
jgi:hypothetical protein